MTLRELTLEEILDLETDKEFWGHLRHDDQDPVPLYNVNTKSKSDENKLNFHTSSISTGNGQFYFVLQIDTNKVSE